MMTLLQKGNLAGAFAILLWATLALFTVSTGAIPPFQLTFIAFFIAFVLGLLWWYKRGADVSLYTKLPLKVWLVGIYGLFGYHFFYFLALKSAPALEANLINYLWPLLIVLLSAFLPQERLRWYHVVGSLLGFLGALVLLGAKGLSFSSEYLHGYGYALLCAFIWSSYSVLSRYFAEVPTEVVGGFCGVSALFSLGAHMLFEQTYLPSLSEMAFSIALGLGPVGLAFFVWDYGMKKGDIKFIGALSYTTPLLSTLLLILFGEAKLTLWVSLSCALIVLGSALSAWPFFKALVQKLSTRNQPLS
jgi:drug/metabolite transporter (DMT)-like permease